MKCLGNNQVYEFPDWRGKKQTNKKLGRKLPEHTILHFFWKRNLIISFQFLHFVSKLKKKFT